MRSASDSAGGHCSSLLLALVSVNPISGNARASCVVMRDTCADSAPSDLRNFRRAGTL